MKKSILGCMCLILVMSCDVPESVTVKGNPELRLYMGSPFKDGERLEDHIGPAKIREMMSDQENLTVYEYRPDSYSDDLQTYVVRYPIAEMQYDVTDYVTEAFEDPESVPPYVIPPNVSSGYLTRAGVQPIETDPLFRVSFSDMSEKVIMVYGGPFGIDLDYDEDFEDNLLLKIPAFGINNYIYGVKVQTDEGEKLRFVNPDTDTFDPADLNPQRELEIFVQVSGPCSGTIAPQSIFVWETARVDISGESDMLSGEHKIENFLGKFLGEGVEFKEVKGYIYAHGIQGSNAKIETLTAKGNDLVSQGTPLVEKPKITFPDLDTDPFTMDLSQHQHSIDGIPSIDLTDLLSSTTPSTLEYNIQAEEMTITNVSGQMTGEKITIDLVIWLPLEFKVTKPSSKPGYVKLDMGEAFPETVSDKDLFGRNDKDDDLFSNIRTVTIFVTNIRNDVIGDKDISILIDSTGATGTGIPFSRQIDLVPAKKEIREVIGYDELPKPFSPRFEILLIKDTNENYATFKIRRQIPGGQPAFDFFLTIEAQTDLNIKL